MNDVNDRDYFQLSEKLLALYREKAKKLDHIQRFYLHLDPDIYDLEQQVDESYAADYFRNKLLALYELWLLDMTPEQRAEFFTHNVRVGGANTNWLVADEEEFAKYEDELVWVEEEHRYRVPAT
jgi:hypothetical protein